MLTSKNPALPGSKLNGSGVFCLKIQIPGTKFQINLKFKNPMTKTLNDKTLFVFWNFCHWNLFDICKFEVWDFKNSMKLQYSKTPPGITKAGFS